MEYYEIYDAYGNSTGRIVEHDYVLKEGEYRAISHLVIFNSKNEMLIQKRGVDKKDFPNCYDLSAGGGVNAEETTYEAAKRELKEELGLTLDFDNRAYFRVYYTKGIDDYFILIKDISLDEIKMRTGEVLDVKWATKDEILHMMKKNEFVHYNEGFIELLFSMKDNRGTYVK